MNASTPTANIARATRERLPSSRIRPTGRPMIDREAGEGAEENGLSEGHRGAIRGP